MRTKCKAKHALLRLSIKLRFYRLALLNPLQYCIYLAAKILLSNFCNTKIISINYLRRILTHIRHTCKLVSRNQVAVLFKNLTIIYI